MLVTYLWKKLVDMLFALVGPRIQHQHNLVRHSKRLCSFDLGNNFEGTLWICVLLMQLLVKSECFLSDAVFMYCIASSRAPITFVTLFGKASIRERLACIVYIWNDTSSIQFIIVRTTT